MAMTRAKRKRLLAKPALGQFKAMHGLNAALRADTHNQRELKNSKHVQFLDSIHLKDRMMGANGPYRRTNMGYWNARHTFFTTTALQPLPQTLEGKNAFYNEAHDKYVKHVHHKKSKLLATRRRRTQARAAKQSSQDAVVSSIAHLVELSQPQAVMGN